MTRYHWILLAAGLTAGLLISGRIVLHAQDRAGARQRDAGAAARRGAENATAGVREPAGAGVREPAADPLRPPTSTASLQDALLRPYKFPFSRPTPLEHACAHLRQTLNAPVVLDRAALNRQNVDPQDPVQLDLDGVRLKTGLKLLLDQLGLTYRLVAEDNLLIITDSAGAEDPADRILSELRVLHRDLHDLQDTVDELRLYLGDEGGQGPRVQKPTIIEEMPESGGGKPEKPPEKPGNARQKSERPGGAPATGGRPVPSRVPLSGPRRRG
jgi:hypothetical protein